MTIGKVYRHYSIEWLHVKTTPSIHGGELTGLLITKMDEFVCLNVGIDGEIPAYTFDWLPEDLNSAGIPFKYHNIIKATKEEGIAKHQKMKWMHIMCVNRPLMGFILVDIDESLFEEVCLLP